MLQSYTPSRESVSLGDQPSPKRGNRGRLEQELDALVLAKGLSGSGSPAGLREMGVPYRADSRGRERVEPGAQIDLHGGRGIIASVRRLPAWMSISNQLQRMLSASSCFRRPNRAAFSFRSPCLLTPAPVFEPDDPPS